MTKNIPAFTFLLTTVFPFCVFSEAPNWNQATVEYAGDKNITVYRSPACGCCHRWIEHLENHGFNVEDIQVNDVNPVKARSDISPQLASCHTAIVEGYFIEGHVPADDIKRLLLSRPDIRGLSVPGMPAGTPGMEMGDRKDAFQVIQLNMDGHSEVFNDYSTY